jgi:hypothetical protein
MFQWWNIHVCRENFVELVLIDKFWEELRMHNCNLQKTNLKIIISNHKLMWTISVATDSKLYLANKNIQTTLHYILEYC